MWRHLTFDRNYKSLFLIGLSSRISNNYQRCQKYATDTSNICTTTQTFDWSKLNSKKSSRMELMSLEIQNVPSQQSSLKSNQQNCETDVFLPEKPEECCGEECEGCVWLLYVNEIIFIYKGNSAKVEEALKCIPNRTIQQYVRESIEDIMKQYK